MKVQALRDSKGEILAIVERRPDELVSGEIDVDEFVSGEIDVGEGEELVEVEVPDEYLEMPPTDFMKQLQADIQAKRLGVKTKK